MPEKDKILRPSLNVRPVSPFTDPAEPTDSPESRLDAFYRRQAKERYERAYKEYEDAHPVRALDWIGYDPRETGLTNHPYARQSHAAHKYAMEKTASDLEEKNLISNWFPTYLHDPTDPIEDWKEGERLQTGAAVSAATFPAMIAASTGALGAVPKILADVKFGYDGVTGLASPEGVQKTWDFIKQGRYARAIPSAAWDALDLGLAMQGLKGLNQFGKYGKQIGHIATRGLNKRLINTPAEVGWPNLKDGAEWQEQKDFLRLPQRFGAGKTYTAPKSSRLQIFPETAFASDVQRQPYQKPWTNLTPLKTVFGSSLNVPDMVDFYRGSKPMFFGDMRQILQDPNFEYFQGRPFIDYERPKGGIGRFYINENRLKQTIGAYKDLYTSRLNLPNTATTEQIYGHLLSNPTKIDPALNEAENIQDILGLSLGYGLKDAMLFKDRSLLDLDGVYKETVPGMFDILSKRLASKQLIKAHGESNGHHMTWQFRETPLDRWKKAKTPKMPLPDLDVQTSTPTFLQELPMHKDRFYRYFGEDALDSYRKTGVVSSYDEDGDLAARFMYPLFSKGTTWEGFLKSPRLTWAISKPGSSLEWRKVHGIAQTPLVNGEFNKAPISEFDFYRYIPEKGYIKLDSNLNLPDGVTIPEIKPTNPYQFQMNMYNNMIAKNQEEIQKLSRCLEQGGFKKSTIQNFKLRIQELEKQIAKLQGFIDELPPIK